MSTCKSSFQHVQVYSLVLWNGAVVAQAKVYQHLHDCAAMKAHVLLRLARPEHMTPISGPTIAQQMNCAASGHGNSTSCMQCQQVLTIAKAACSACKQHWLQAHHSRVTLAYEHVGCGQVTMYQARIMQGCYCLSDLSHHDIKFCRSSINPGRQSKFIVFAVKQLSDV